MKEKIINYDTAEIFNNPEEIHEYLRVVSEEGDPKMITIALGNAAKAHGMLKIANQTGLGRESLYKSLSGKGRPYFDTISKVADSLGFKITLVPKSQFQPT